MKRNNTQPAEKIKTASAPETRKQPDTADVQAALDRSKAYTRKLYTEVQSLTGEGNAPRVNADSATFVRSLDGCVVSETDWKALVKERDYYLLRSSELGGKLDQVTAERDEWKAQLDAYSVELAKTVIQLDELLAALNVVRQALHDSATDGFDRTAFIRTTLNDAIANAEQ